MPGTPQNVRFEPFFRGLTLVCDDPGSTNWAETEAELYLDNELVASAKDASFAIPFDGLDPGQEYTGRMRFIDQEEIPTPWADASEPMEPGKASTEDLAPQSISQIVVHSFSSLVSTNSTTYVTMPNMNQTFEVTEPGTLLVVAVAPASGLWVTSFVDFLYVYPQTRLLINDQVVEEDPQPPNYGGWDTTVFAVSPASFYVRLEFDNQDTYPKNVDAKLQWRAARYSDNVSPEGRVIRATRRAITFTFLKR